MYADDATLLCANKDTSTLVLNLNNDLLSLKSYCMRNKLIINLNKTKILYFQRPNLNLQVEYDSSPIDVVQSFKYLGVHVDSKMKFDSQCSFILKKLNSCLFVLYRYRNIFPRHIPYHEVVMKSKIKVLSKLMSGTFAPSLTSYLTKPSHYHQTRFNQGSYCQPACSKKIGSKAFEYWAPRIINNM